MTLAPNLSMRFQKGQQLTVQGYYRHCHRTIRRLASLGLVPGTQVIICHVSLFKGPLAISIRGSSVALSRQDAAEIHWFVS